MSPDDSRFLFDVADEGLHRTIGVGIAWMHCRRSPTKTINEDSTGLIPVNQSSAVFVVADGVGGHSAGEQASRMVVEYLRDAVADAVANDQLLRTAILNGLERANQAVLDLKLGSASTAAVVEVSGPVVRTYHVGDSGIVICGSRGKMKLQTIAHAPVSYAVEAGILNEKEAMRHQDRHLVSNVVGSSEMRIEIGPTTTLAPQDTLMLASDGLFDNLYPDEIVELIRKRSLPEAAARLGTVVGDRMAGIKSG
ncbi:MAG: serine/threonine-protein phosphatase, partial [Pirellulales bacterium]|nr:serine/threonine-protein phosphatase [Pirellulales bacterium]